jgi:hypothetical protein
VKGGKMVILKKVGVLSVAKVYAVIMAIFGLFMGIVTAVVGKYAVGLEEITQTQGLNVGLGAWSILVMPIFYGLMGFVSGAVAAWLYNVVAKKVGGVEVELSK